MRRSSLLPLFLWLVPSIASAQIDVEARRARVSTELLASVATESTSEREASLRRAVLLADQLQLDDPERTQAEAGLALLLAESDRCEEALPMLERSVASATRRGDVAARARSLLRRAVCSLRDPHASRGALEALRTEIHADDQLELLEAIAVAQVGSGELELALATADAIGGRGGLGTTIAQYVRGIVALRRGDVTVAARELGAVVDSAVASTARGDLASVRRETGHAAALADRVYAELYARPPTPELARIAFSAALSLRGRTLDLLGRAIEARDHSPSLQTEARLDRLRNLRGRLARSLLERTTDEGTLRRDAAEAQGIERSLSVRYGLTTSSGGPLASEVFARIPRGSVLIEVVRYRPRAVAGLYAAAPPSAPELVALVWAGFGSPTWVRLGPESEIDRLVAAFRSAVMLPAQHPDDDPARYLPAAIAAARALHDRTWAPLASHVGRRDRILFVAEGSLNLVPLAALHDGRRFLGERYRFQHPTTGRDLLHPVRPTLGREAVLFGDPDYGRRLATTGPLARYVFPALEHAREELRAIHARFPGALVITGADATEQRLLGLRAPAVLHIPSHGIFVGTDTAPSRGSRGIRVEADAPTSAHYDELSALARSALVLTATGRATDGDGLATALEIASMDLRGTELVTLSACESGVGAVRDGEGVYGLRRAFLVAGARSLVTSLWSIDDESARDLMTDFYARYSAGDASVEDALHDAAARVRRARPHPLFWAPFVAVGAPNTVHARGQSAAPATSAPEAPPTIATSGFVASARWAEVHPERWTYDCGTAVSGPASFAFTSPIIGRVAISVRSQYLVARDSSGAIHCGGGLGLIGEMPAGRVDVWAAGANPEGSPPQAFVSISPPRPSERPMLHAAAPRHVSRLPDRMRATVAGQPGTDFFDCERQAERVPDATLRVTSDLGLAAISASSPAFAMRDPAGTLTCHDVEYTPGPAELRLREGEYDLWFAGAGQVTVATTAVRGPPLPADQGGSPRSARMLPALHRAVLDPSAVLAPIEGTLEPSPGFATPGWTCDQPWWRDLPPTHAIDVRSPIDRLRVLVTSIEDTTLVVGLPDGTEHCSLDAYGMHPAFLGAVPQGRLSIWIAPGRAILGETAYRMAFGTGPDLEAPQPESRFDWSRRDELETLATSASRSIVASAVPTRLETELRPSIPVIAVDPTCTEDARVHPDPVARVSVAASTRMLRLVGVEPGSTQLVVRRPDGSYVCSDAEEYHGWLDVPSPAAGEYVVWLGILSTGGQERARGTLFVQAL